MGVTRLDVIPVIDIRHGQVVSARGGHRDLYRPIETPLSPTSDPLDVAGGLLGLWPFRALYIADLDHIVSRGSESSLNEVARIITGHPDPRIWLDNGARSRADVQAIIELPGALAVIGSETGITVKGQRELKAEFGDRLVLSLDYFADGVFRGDPGLLESPDCWPQTVIVMSLHKVGMASGPDLDRISAIACDPSRRVYAAGGVRGATDLHAAAAAGARGALIATGLHTGTVTAADLDVLGKSFCV